MDFAEFESWFKKTCVAVERFRLRGAKTSPSGKKQKSPTKSPAKPTPAAAQPSPLKAGTTPSKYTPAALDPHQVTNPVVPSAPSAPSPPSVPSAPAASNPYFRNSPSF